MDWEQLVFAAHAGLKATYLVHKAGWEVVVVDKDSCGIFYQLVNVAQDNEFLQYLDGIQLLIPRLSKRHH